MRLLAVVTRTLAWFGLAREAQHDDAREPLDQCSHGLRTLDGELRWPAICALTCALGADRREYRH